MQQTYGKNANYPIKPTPMLTIFFHGKPFIIKGESPGLSPQISGTQNLITIRNPAVSSLEKHIEAAKENAPGYVFVTDDEPGLFREFQHIYRPMEAAGGLVTNPAGDILLIFRRRKWDLPKGKIDAGETPEQAALREISEETGLSHIQLGEKLIRTWHGYRQGTEKILKETHWYRVSFTGTELTVPQIEEDITDIQWIRPENVHKYIPYSYPNLKAVFQAAGYGV